MSKKLSSSAIASLKHLPAASTMEALNSNPLYPGFQQLLDEVERTRPKWSTVGTDQYKPGITYHVAGTTNLSEKAVWLGRGRYDLDFEGWVDDNTMRPFPRTTTITHFYQELTPTEFIGQPE